MADRAHLCGESPWVRTHQGVTRYSPGKEKKGLGKRASSWHCIRPVCLPSGTVCNDN